MKPTCKKSLQVGNGRDSGHSLPRLVRRILCVLIGHKYRVVQRFSPDVRRVKCDRCGSDWGMNDRVRVLVNWDEDLEEMHQRCGAKIKEPKYFTANAQRPDDGA